MLNNIFKIGILFLMLSQCSIQHAVYAQNRIKKISPIKRVIFEIFPFSARRKFIKLLKESNESEHTAAQKFLGNLSENREAKMRKKNPLIFNWLIVLAYEGNESEIPDEKVLLSYSIMANMESDDFTDRDWAVLEKLSKWVDGRKVTREDLGLQDDGIAIPGGITKKAGDRTFELIEVKQSAEKQLQEKLRRVSEIESQIATLKEEVKSKKKVERLKVIDLQDLSLKREETEAKLDWVKEQISGSSIVEDGNAEVDLEVARNIESGVMKASPVDYGIGRYCDSDIEKLISNIVKVFFVNIAELNPEDINKLQFEIEIVGHADGIGYGTLLGLRSAYDIDEFYKVDGVNRRIRLSAGERFTNEQLGFMRALCAYELLKQELLPKGIDLSDSKHEISFAVVEHEDKGPQFRKIEIDVFVDGLYRHYKLQIEQLEREIAQLKLEKGKLLSEIKDLQIKVEELTGLLKNYGPEGGETKKALREMRQRGKKQRA